ncbi:MAG: TonB-dependent receptor [Elusimicrobiota bacterium]|nr:TonB-dependent receptor [Elusimicrobiota bacterium]
MLSKKKSAIGGKSVVLILACWMVCCTHASAYFPENEVATIVVTAERRDEDITKIAANIDVITSAELEKSGADSIAEILENYAGIHLRSASGNESLANIDLRGFGGDNPFGKTLILLNGRRLNRPDMASINWLQIAPDSIERIEIIRGTGSALYGDNAAAGVINIITKKGFGPEKASASAKFGSFGEKTTSLNLNSSDEISSIFLNVQSRKKDGYRDRTAFGSDSAGINISRSFRNSLNASLDLSFNKTAFQMPGALTEAQLSTDRKQASNTDDDGVNEYMNANISLEKAIAGGLFETNFMYGEKDIASNMASFWSGGFSDSKIKTFAFTPRFNRKYSLGEYDSRFLCGIDYYKESLDLERFDDRPRTTPASSAELKKDSVGFYLNNKLHITDNIIFTAGGRYENAQIEAVSVTAAGAVEYDESKKHDLGAADISLLYKPGQKNKVFTKFSTLYRCPFTDEQAIYSGWGNKFVADLEAEKGKSAEIGSEIYFLQDLKAGLTLFRISMKNEIAWSASTNQNENLDETKHDGIELSASWDISKNSKLYGNYTHSAAEFTDGQYKGKKLSLVPAGKAFIAADISPARGLVLSAKASHTGNCYLSGDYNNEVSKLKDYTLLDISLRYKSEKAPFSLFAAVENALNEKYSTLGYYSSWSGSTYYPSPERSFKAGVSIDF